jgi:fatty-acyl-CoA synthase
MLARLRSEIAYFKGLRRAISSTTPIGKNPTRTFCDRAEELAAAHGSRAALISDRETFSYAVWDARANRYARWAQAQGYKKGDVVCLLMPNRPEYLSIWLGLARAGLTTALINTNLAGPGLAHSVNIVGARAIIVEESLTNPLNGAVSLLTGAPTIFHHGGSAAAPRIDEIVETFSNAPLDAAERVPLDIQDGALFVYTSGTTGLPKAARITHSRLQRIMYGFSAAINARPGDRLYQCLPMYHSNGGILAPGAMLAAGGSVFIRERFSAKEFWSEIVAQECTLFVYVGELCRYLLNAPPTPADRAHKIRLCVGNGLRPDIFTRFQERFDIKEILEFYGATEGNVALFNFDSHPGAVGRIPRWAASRFPIKIAAFDIEAGEARRNAEGRCIECGIDEVGELLGEILDDPDKPAARFDGYADADATRTKILTDAFRPGDRWFRTGDLLRRDAQGYYYFIDRIGDTFRWKGENVSTTEVSEAIVSFPGVQEVSVYGVAAPGYEGRAGMAALVVDDPKAFDLAGLRAYIAAHLPAYARPAFLRFRHDLDITGTFKQKKMALIAEGFDVAKFNEPVFFDNRAAGAYTRIGADFAGKLRAGSIKL